MNKKYTIYLPFVFAIVLIVGIFLGSNLQPKGSAFSLFSTPYNEQNKINDILNYIEKDYVDTIDREKLTEQTINQLLSNLDPHSVYLPPVDNQYSTAELEGNFEGIGVQFRIYKDTILVVLPIKDGPSEKVGIKSGDRIIKVDSKLVAGKKIENPEVMKLLKGKRGTRVHLHILRKGTKGLLEFDVTRDFIPTYSVDASYMISPGIGYVRITSFTQTTHFEFIKAVMELKSKGMNKLILDLRDNPGGLLQSAIKIADEFLEDGKTIVYQEGRKRKKEITSSTTDGHLHNTEVVLLISEFSASASEIVAGALQDNDRAIIVGRRSFGKGLVQEPIELEDGSAIRLTVARYYTPTGRCIQKSYANGSNDYFSDIEKRYFHGEMNTMDSLKNADTTKYITAKGKILFGGGGITPDYFIPIDTGLVFSYYNHLLNRGILTDFALNYTDENRSYLSKFNSPESFIKGFTITEPILNNLIAFASKSGVHFESKKYQSTKTEIALQLKAMIARNIFDDNGYIQIVNTKDKTVQKAVEVLKKI